MSINQHIHQFGPSRPNSDQKPKPRPPAKPCKTHKGNESGETTVSLLQQISSGINHVTSGDKSTSILVETKLPFVLSDGPPNPGSGQKPPTKPPAKPKPQKWVASLVNYVIKEKGDHSCFVSMASGQQEFSVEEFVLYGASKILQLKSLALKWNGAIATGA